MVTKTDRSIALALDWARAHAGKHADTIIEALTAYDPERVGARTVQHDGTTHGPGCFAWGRHHWACALAEIDRLRAEVAASNTDAPLADTQRAIIEAAEARGYARAKVEGDVDARDAARYRWLRECFVGPDFKDGCTIQFEWPADQAVSVKLDECIDAAIAAQRKEGES